MRININNMKRLLYFFCVFLIFSWVCLSLLQPSVAQTPTSALSENASTPTAQPDSQVLSTEPELTPPPSPETQPAPVPNVGAPPIAVAEAILDHPSWIHEGAIGIYGSGSQVGPGATYTFLHRPSILYSFGAHAGLTHTHYENTDILLKTQVLHAQTALEGRFCLTQDNCTLWISGWLGAGFFLETQSNSDAMNADWGFLWGFGIGVDLLASRHFSWGLSLRYVKLVPAGTIDDAIRDYYHRAGIGTHIAYHD